MESPWSTRCLIQATAAGKQVLWEKIMCKYVQLHLSSYPSMLRFVVQDLMFIVNNFQHDYFAHDCSRD